jgi:hypothetical protein
MSSLGGLNLQTFSSGGASPSGASTDAVAAYSGPGGAISFLGQPFSFYLGMIALLFALKWFSEHPNTPIDPAHLHIGGYDLMAVGVSAVVFIVTMKLILNKYQVMGLTQLFNYV